MIGRCKQVDIGDALSGMVLAAPVLDPSGATLLPGAVVLTEAMLISLRRRGITSVDVVDDAVSEQDQEIERRNVHARLDRLFRVSGGTGCAARLRRAIEEYRIGDLS